MTLREIRNGIIRLLRDYTDVPNITGEDLEVTKNYFSLVKDGEEEILPTFQIAVNPVSASVAAAGYHRDKSVFVDISYLEARYTSNESIQQRLDEISEILFPCFQIGGRAFAPMLSFNITDGIGHCTFTLEWTDTVSFGTEEPPAGEINISL